MEAGRLLYVICGRLAKFLTLFCVSVVDGQVENVSVDLKPHSCFLLTSKRLLGSQFVFVRSAVLPLRFPAPPAARELLVGRLRAICEAEGVDCDEGTLAALVETSEGDLRKAITSLQSAARLQPAGGLSADDVRDVMGVSQRQGEFQRQLQGRAKAGIDFLVIS